jgi:hypothetical protein
MTPHSPNDHCSAQALPGHAPANLDGRQTHQDALLRQASETFQREVEELKLEHEGEWVAYHGSHRVAFGTTRPALWEECLRRGLPEGEFWVFHIQKAVGEETIGLADARIEYVEE